MYKKFKEKKLNFSHNAVLRNKNKFLQAILKLAAGMCVLMFLFPPFIYSQSIPIIIRESNPLVADTDLSKAGERLATEKAMTKPKTTKPKTSKRPVVQNPPAASPKTTQPKQGDNTKKDLPQTSGQDTAQTKPQTQTDLAATNDAAIGTNENAIAALPVPLPQEASDSDTAEKSDENMFAPNDLLNNNEQEEAAKAASESYWRSALLQENSDLEEQALQSYRKVLEFQDRYYLPALARLAYLTAKNGATQMLAEADLAGDNDKAAVYYYQGSGFESRFLQRPNETQRLPQALAAYNEVLRLAPQSVWAQRANLRMARLYYNLKNYENSLFCLLSFMRSSNKEQNSTQESRKLQNYDLAWFLLGRLLEVSEKNFDPLRAIAAYRKVLQFPNSLYKEPASRYLQALEQKYPTTSY